MSRIALASLTLLLATGCGSLAGPDDDTEAEPAAPASSSAPADQPPADEPAEPEAPAEPQPADVAAAVAEVPTVQRVVELTAETDPNSLLGRPQGYEAATVFYDQAGACPDGPGASCGATLEVWPDAEGAEGRLAYLEDIGPPLVNEYDTLVGRYLLRVDGALTPDQAAPYEDALRSVLGR